MAAEATVVKLYCQCPPIEKMDDSLNSLENVVHLSLSTNSIDRMIALPKLSKSFALTMPLCFWEQRNQERGLKKILKFFH